tara:strand:- start:2977 stop:4050 length:1074 start_codon:yes stop_codon:yes gene_type:complete
MITFLSFIFVIGVVVFIHELGHFLAAKSVGVRVEKFYIGFNLFGLGWKVDYKGTEYGIGLFPLGGYVKLAGVIDESMDVQSTGADDEFKSKNTLQKIWIMSAGVIMNFILAIFIFSHLTYHTGISEPSSSTIIGGVAPKYPAETLGLQSGDEIISINGVLVSNWEEMAKNIHSKPNEIIQISWERNEQIINGSVQTVIAEQPLPWNKHIMKGIIGIQPVFTHRNITILESFSKGFMQTYFWLEITYKTLLSLMQGNVSMKEMAGPIMIAKMAGETATTGGFYALLGLMGIISVNLGLINILPIPGLDGGHVFIALIEGIINKEIPLKIKLGIQQIGMLLILILFFTIMFNDIQRILQ